MRQRAGDGCEAVTVGASGPARRERGPSPGRSRELGDPLVSHHDVPRLQVPVNDSVLMCLSSACAICTASVSTSRSGSFVCGSRSASVAPATNSMTRKSAVLRIEVVDGTDVCVIQLGQCQSSLCAGCSGPDRSRGIPLTGLSTRRHVRAARPWRGRRHPCRRRRPARSPCSGPGLGRSSSSTLGWNLNQGPGCHLRPPCHNDDPCRAGHPAWIRREFV